MTSVLPESANSEDFILSRNGGCVQLWNLSSNGKLEHEFCPWQNQNPVCVAANSDGSAFAFGGKEIILRTPFGIPVGIPVVHSTQDSPSKTSSNTSTSLAFSDCSKYLFVGREVGKIYRIDLQGEKEVHCCYGHKSAVTGITLLPNEPSKLASVSLGGTLALHLVSGRRLALIPDPNRQELLSICSSSLNKGDVLTGGDQGITQLWAVKETRNVQSWSNKSGSRISALAGVTSPSKFIITTSFDKSMCLIDERAKEIQQTLFFESPLHSLATRDGQYNVAVGDNNGRVHVYDLRSGSTKLHFETSRVHDGQKAEPVNDLHLLDSTVLKKLKNAREVSISGTSLLEEKGGSDCKRTPYNSYNEPDLNNADKDYSRKTFQDGKLNKSLFVLNKTPTKTPVQLQNEASNDSFSFGDSQTSNMCSSPEAVESLALTPHNSTTVFGNHPVPPEFSSSTKGGGAEIFNQKNSFIRNDLKAGYQTPSEWGKRRDFSQVPKSADQLSVQVCNPSGGYSCPSKKPTTTSPSIVLGEVTNKKGSDQQHGSPFPDFYEQIKELVQNLPSPKLKQVKAETSLPPAEIYHSPSVYSHSENSKTSTHMESSLPLAISNPSPEGDLSLTSRQSEQESSPTNIQRNESILPVSSAKCMQEALNFPTPQTGGVSRERCSCGNQRGTENLTLEAIKQLTKKIEGGYERTEDRITAVEGRINAMIFGLEKIFAKVKGLEENQHVLDHNFRVVSDQLRTLL